jgi:hypothetical protein
MITRFFLCDHLLLLRPLRKHVAGVAAIPDKGIHQRDVRLDGLHRRGRGLSAEREGRGLAELVELVALDAPVEPAVGRAPVGEHGRRARAGAAVDEALAALGEGGGARGHDGLRHGVVHP